ncbi:MAG: flavin reductase family protein [Pseudomonadota bacterium]
MSSPVLSASAPLLAPDAGAYRQAFRRTAASIWVITAAHGAQRTGLTATSVVSLSAEPAELMVSVQPGSSTFPLLQASGRFGVNLLTRTQQAIADRFAGRDGCQGEARYAQADWHCTPNGVWLLSDAAVAMNCEVAEIVWRRTHALVIGRISALRLAEGPCLPLLHSDGRYVELATR